MELKEIFFVFFVSLTATIGYCIPLCPPKKGILPGAMASAFAYLLYLFAIRQGLNTILASFFSAFLIGSIGEALSRIQRMPATIYVLPGLITLVPGGGMYYTMAYLIQDNTNMFLSEAVNTFFIAVFLSVGILASTIFSRSIKSFREHSIKRMKMLKYTK